MISRTGRYALRAVVHLAAEARESPVPVDTVAERLDVPRNYLSKTLHRLAKAGVLDSTRGPHGGFRLAEPASELTLEDVLSPFDEEEVRRQCLLGRDRCTDEEPCAAHHRWKQLNQQLTTFFRDTTVAELVAGHGLESAAVADAPAAG